MTHRVAAVLLAGVVGIAALPSAASGQPPTGKDELCSAVGMTSESALQPRDRVFFKKSCVCFARECAALGTPRGLAIAKEASAWGEKLAAEARAKAQREPAARLDVQAKADAFFACYESPTESNCVPASEAFKSACTAYRSEFQPTRMCKVDEWRTVATKE